MPGTHSESDKPADELAEQGMATPDEDGPHDVPDDKVIEQTLPTKPVKAPGSRPG